MKEVRSIVTAPGTLTQAGTRTTLYMHPDNAGGLGFELEINAPTTASAANPVATSQRHYLSVGGITVGVLVSGGNASGGTIVLKKVEHWHHDHLGSLVATTDHSGAVTARYAYDPFGKRRNPNGAYDAINE